MQEFLKNNVDKLWTMFATIIGALISYLATTASEKRKEKRNLQKEKMKEVFIPLCVSIEDALEAMNQYKTINSTDFDSKIKAPIDFLKAEKRVYLSKNEKKFLEQYKSKVDTFYRTWQEEQEFVFQEYCQWITEQMHGCSQGTNAIWVRVDMWTKAKDYSAYVLERNSESIKDDVAGIEFIYNDDPENYRKLLVKFDNTVINFCGAMKCGVSTVDDIDDQETVIACEVYDYFQELDDKKVMSELIAETKTNDNLYGLASKAGTLRTCLLTDIDKITG